jgi:hypothetical protein
MKKMKKTFGLIALLVTSSAVLATPALARDRDDCVYNNNYAVYTVRHDDHRDVRDRHDDRGRDVRNVRDVHDRDGRR